MNNRLGGTIVGARLRLTVAMPAVFAICAIGLPLLQLPAAAGEAASQRQIATAFAALVKLPTVDRGSPYLEGYDTAMRTALQQAGSLVTEGYEVPVKVRDLVGTAQIVGPEEAVVPFTVRVIPKSIPSSSLTYDAVALRVGGRWKVSWTTMCLLIESGRQLCPPTPRGLVAGDVLPSATSGSLALSQGVVRPGPLAIAPNGGLLVSDAARNQILEWRDGTVSVVAGDGLEGFSGDGGPAVDAELNDPGELAVGANGAIYFVDGGNDDRVRAVSAAGTITTVAGDGSTGEGADVGHGEAATDVPLTPSGVAVAPDGTLYVSSGSDIRTVAPDGVISTLVAARSMLGLWNSDFSYNLHASDRAWWPGDVATFTRGELEGRQTVGSAAAAANTLHAPAIKAACGRKLLEDSIAVVMEPSPYDFGYQHVYLIDRDGTPLVYFGAY
jgi:hypothetical protein